MYEQFCGLVDQTAKTVTFNFSYPMVNGLPRNMKTAGCLGAHALGMALGPSNSASAETSACFFRFASARSCLSR